MERGTVRSVARTARTAETQSVCLDLAAAIADGRLPDWSRAHDNVDPKERDIVEQLRLIALIAGARQSPIVPPAADPEPNAVVTQAATESRPLGRWGDLILIEEVGEGSFGTVYRAHDPTLDRPVALKLLRPISSKDKQLEAKLLAEGQTLARVNHPNVVRVYGAGTHDGRLGLWMEFIRGRTLDEMLRSHGPFSAVEASLVGYTLCAALAAVHHADLVHRDVKAQNVMREEGGRLVLMDFGAGQRQSVAGAAGKRIVGTPLYLAPEVLMGGRATVKSDLYSLGILLYHLVTNAFPVKGSTYTDIAWAHANHEATPLQDARLDLPSSFVRVIEQAIHVDPAKRFDRARHFQEALAQIPDLSVMPLLVRTSHGVDLQIPSVAVLPFSDMSPAKDQECFCDGMTEELISGLAQISGLRVAARTSTFQFKGQTGDVRRIGDALNVTTVLDGSVRKDGNRLRITVELIGTTDGYHLWSRSFDRDLKGVFAVQTEITASVVGALKGKLAADKAAIALTPRARNLDAYEFYLEGRYHWNKRTEDELQKSVICFKRAIEHDANYAEAHAAIADAYVTLGTYGAMAPQATMPLARLAVDEALKIDPGLAEAYACRGCVRSVYAWEWREAEDDFLHAIRLNPGYATAHHWYAINHLVPQGRFDEASRALREALEIDPLALAIKTSVGMKSYFAGRYDEAVRELTRTIAIDESFGFAHLILGAAYTEQGHHAAALRALDSAVRCSGRTPDILAALGYLRGISGDVGAARAVLDELVSLSVERYVSPAKIAQVHVGLGEYAAALDRLEEAQAEHAADLAWLGVRPVFAPLHSEPRFTALFPAMRLDPPRGDLSDVRL